MAWAVNKDGEEISWNHLTGDATVVNYRDRTAWEYNAWAFQCVTNVVEGAPCGSIAGEINLNGLEYDACPSKLLLDFYAVDSFAFNGPRAVQIDTDVTRHPASTDIRQETEGPLTTKA